MFGYFGQERLICEGLQKVDEAIELVVGELGIPNVPMQS
jgi:hypothetical protein